MLQCDLGVGVEKYMLRSIRIRFNAKRFGIDGQNGNQTDTFCDIVTVRLAFGLLCVSMQDVTATDWV